jgi:protein-S-isoprenylcysteine O-methyltransferase Ste14
MTGRLLNRSKSSAEPFMKQPGRIWFAVQGVLALGLVVAPFLSRADLQLALLLPGGVLFVAGLISLIVSYRWLGSSHSAWTRPVDGAHLVTSGPYAIVRHPVYASFILLGLGLELAFGSLLGLGFVLALFVYYDLRTREEEKWLRITYPDFDSYCRQVRGRLIPGLY